MLGKRATSDDGAFGEGKMVANGSNYSTNGLLKYYVENHMYTKRL